MTNLYAKDEKAVCDLHDVIVRDILAVLRQRGYRTGTVTSGCTFDITPSYLIINGTNTDKIDIDSLLGFLREAYRVSPNIPHIIPSRSGR